MQRKFSKKRGGPGSEVIRDKVDRYSQFISKYQGQEGMKIPRMKQGFPFGP